MIREGTKVCKCCGRLLSVSMFRIHRDSQDYYWDTCKDCCRKERRELRDRQRNRVQQEPVAAFQITDFTDDMLFAELRRRGFDGELNFSKKVPI